MKAHSYGVIWIKINDCRSIRLLIFIGTDESTLGKDSSSPLIHHDQIDVGSMIASDLNLPKGNMQPKFH